MPDSLESQQLMERWITRHIVRAPRTMYDIGVGPKTEAKTLKEYYPDMTVFGCEPLLLQYPFGAFRDYPGEIMPVAIGSTCGEIDIHYSPNDLLDASGMRRLGSQTCTKAVTVWTLDQFDMWCGQPKGILLWMDIEGMELEALRGADELLKSHRVRWINLEERREDMEGWPKAKDINDLLASYGYVRVQEYNKHVRHQDVIYRYKGEDHA